MDEHPPALQALRRVEAALTATAHFAPPDARLIEDATDAAARELLATGQAPEALRGLTAQVTRTDLAQDRGDLTERLRRAVESTLARCEQERRTPTDPQRAVGTTGEFRVAGEHAALPESVAQ